MAICSGRGQCVTSFLGNQQTAVCVCGNFPVDPAVSLTTTCNLLVPPTCQLHRLQWVPDGYVEATIGPNYCREPQPGCRYPPDSSWARPGGDQYIRATGFGCEVPRGNLNVMPPPGACVIAPGQTLPSVTSANYLVTASGFNWQCQCLPGQYGAQCEYVTLAGACYDPSVEATLASTASLQIVSRETTCIWNAHIAQWEALAETSLPPSLQPTQTPTQRNLCRGVACSGHGTCSHAGENNITAETYTAAGNTDPYYSYNSPTLASPAEQAFTAAVLARISAQRCTCAAGWTGPYCSVPTCALSCASGGTCSCPAEAASDPRIKCTCTCPTTQSGLVLVGGAYCQGPVCGGHGTLTGNVPANYRCACTPPYYQGPLLARICQEVCPGVLATEQTAGGAVTICTCLQPTTGLNVSCSLLPESEQPPLPTKLMSVPLSADGPAQHQQTLQSVGTVNSGGGGAPTRRPSRRANRERV